MLFPCLKTLPGSLPQSVSQILFQLPLYRLCPLQAPGFLSLGLFPLRYIASSAPLTPHSPFCLSPSCCPGPMSLTTPHPTGEHGLPWVHSRHCIFHSAITFLCGIYSAILFSLLIFGLLIYFVSFLQATVLSPVSLCPLLCCSPLIKHGHEHLKRWL